MLVYCLIREIGIPDYFSKIKDIIGIYSDLYKMKDNYCLHFDSDIDFYDKNNQWDILEASDDGVLKVKMKDVDHVEIISYKCYIKELNEETVKKLNDKYTLKCEMECKSSLRNIKG